MEDTVDVVFESANFDGTTIRKTALALGMRVHHILRHIGTQQGVNLIRLHLQDGGLWDIVEDVNHPVQHLTGPQQFHQFAGPVDQTTLGGYSEEQKLEQKLGAVCRSCGCDEIITYSFISPTWYDKIGWPTAKRPGW